MSERLWLEAGDAASFGQLYDTHVTSVYRYALRMLGKVADAEDITQEVFVLVWVKRSKIRIVDESLLPWLLVTTRNLSLNRIKLRGRETRNASLDSAEVFALHPQRGAEEEALARMLGAAIAEAIDELSEADQTLYHLCISEGLSYQKAADAMGVSHGVVRNRLSAVRRTLRLRLLTQHEGLS
ncbi:RNA polymerase sigma factor [Microterricola viridarii]|uniref:RNA polymerase sigma-70 factor, ECF subfamily n=1 Tax=Microterricola viridarii TaxID=412690 RepID=A0A1H1X8D0_9MICO|nr:RNA polymerase sigma factor [Microterricola viridarii]SDT05538.1 RNA polymerase sigma-70 factor, ECF subfamily [Microterricola viridarii]